MKRNKILDNSILEAVNNQIKINNPPETKATLKRLVDLGYSDLDAKKLIGQCLLLEMHTIMKEQKPFNKDRFVASLNNLPDPPSENKED